MEAGNVTKTRLSSAKYNDFVNEIVDDKNDDMKTMEKNIVYKGTKSLYLLYKSMNDKRNKKANVIPTTMINFKMPKTIL